MIHSPHPVPTSKNRKPNVVVHMSNSQPCGASKSASQSVGTKKPVVVYVRRWYEDFSHHLPLLGLIMANVNEFANILGYFL